MLTRRNCLRTLAATAFAGLAAQPRKPNFVVGELRYDRVP
jgi:hypothetical protein